MATADPFKSFEAALPGIIAESPTQIIRYREYVADTFRNTTANYTVGPYTVRVEPMKAATSQDIWDEKGNVAHLLFQMVCHGIPAKVDHGGVLQPMFKLGDKVVDEHDNEYRVVAPQFSRGKVLQVTLELRG